MPLFHFQIPPKRIHVPPSPMVRPLHLLFLSCLLLLVLVGCGVPYSALGSSGGNGGHKTVPMGKDEFEITYLSNQSGGQPSNRMRELTLLRAAEVTLEYGYSHFVVEGEIEDAQTKWTMKSTTSPIGGGISSGSGIGIGGSTGGIGIGSSPGGIGIGSSTGGIGSSSSSRGTVTSSTPVPVSIPELTLRIRCHHGVPSTAFKGDLYDAARLRDILAVQYNIDVGGTNPPARPPPTVRVIE
jgi:hypothetical protein